MKETYYFKLFQNCILTEGIERSIIVDLQKSNYFLIPNDMKDVIKKLSKLDVKKIILEYGEINTESINEYLEFLESNELGFFCTEEELGFFPNMDLSLDQPYQITNAIIEELRDVSKIKPVVEQLERLGSEALELVYYNEINNSDLESIIEEFKTSSIKYLNLTVKYDKTKTESFFSKIISINLRINKILLHGSVTKIEFNHDNFQLTSVICIEKLIHNFSFCGNVNYNFFNSSLQHFTESLNHNSCLHKKIAIDKDGYIKNCPAMVESFGNIKNTSLEEALNKESFKKYWNINKDQIDVCKDCEFRHICTDCRAFIENPEDQYSKPLKCGYNPYTCEWEEWSTNPLKQKAIEYYGMQELVKKEDRL